MEIINRELLKGISKRMEATKKTLAVAESVTSGLLQFLISNAPDASHYFQGGVTPYNLGQKTRHLHIEPLHAEEVNSVSHRVAQEMALGVADYFSSDWTIAVTGYATPSSESNNLLFAFYAITYENEIVKTGKVVPSATEPTMIQVEYANTVLEEFLKLC